MNINIDKLADQYYASRDPEYQVEEQFQCIECGNMFGEDEIGEQNGGGVILNYENKTCVCPKCYKHLLKDIEQHYNKFVDSLSINEIAMIVNDTDIVTGLTEDIKE